MTDPLYIPLLKNKTYHNLDESGVMLDSSNAVDGGHHSMDRLLSKWLTANNKHVNQGKAVKDQCYYDEGDSVEWAGAVRWYRGTLQVVHATPEFPAWRELLIYHRFSKGLDIPALYRAAMFEDMIEYGLADHILN